MKETRVGRKKRVGAQPPDPVRRFPNKMIIYLAANQSALRETPPSEIVTTTKVAKPRRALSRIYGAHGG